MCFCGINPGFFKAQLGGFWGFMTFKLYHRALLDTVHNICKFIGLKFLKNTTIMNQIICGTRY